MLQYAKFISLLSFALAALLGATSVSAQIQKIVLSTGTVTAEVTPDIGGRLVSFALKNQPNFLLLAD